MTRVADGHNTLLTVKEAAIAAEMLGLPAVEETHAFNTIVKAVTLGLYRLYYIPSEAALIDHVAGGLTDAGGRHTLYFQNTLRVGRHHHKNNDKGVEDLKLEGTILETDEATFTLMSSTTNQRCFARVNNGHPFEVHDNYHKSVINNAIAEAKAMQRIEAQGWRTEQWCAPPMWTNGLTQLPGNGRAIKTLLRNEEPHENGSKEITYTSTKRTRAPWNINVTHWALTAENTIVYLDGCEIPKTAVLALVKGLVAEGRNFTLTTSAARGHHIYSAVLKELQMVYGNEKGAELAEKLTNPTTLTAWVLNRDRTSELEASRALSELVEDENEEVRASTPQDAGKMTPSYHYGNTEYNYCVLGRPISSIEVETSQFGSAEDVAAVTVTSTDIARAYMPRIRQEAGDGTEDNNRPWVAKITHKGVIMHSDVPLHWDDLSNVPVETETISRMYSPSALGMM